MLLDQRLSVSYPDAVQSPDGAIYIIYEYDRMGQMKIDRAVFTEQDVASGRIISAVERLRVVVHDAGEPNPDPDDSPGDQGVWSCYNMF